MAPRQRNAGGRAALVSRIVSCGVVVTDGRHVLIGHATGSPRWDIPKGQANPGEADEAAARRELWEETGLGTNGVALVPLGRHAYLPRKDLALFAWLVDTMPDAASLICHSHFDLRGRSVPEFDRFACPAWPDAIPMLGKAMAKLMAIVSMQTIAMTRPPG